ncbi:MAG: hypothetical protein ABIE94_01215 [archaeon]
MSTLDGSIQAGDSFGGAGSATRPGIGNYVSDLFSTIGDFIRSNVSFLRSDVSTGRRELEQILKAEGSEYAESEIAIYNLFQRTKTNYDRQVRQDLRSTLSNHKRDGTLSITDELMDDVLTWKDRVAHRPAYIVVLGVNPDDPEHRAHLLNGRYEGACIGKKVGDPKIAKELEKIAYQDGAILVGKDGAILGTNVQLVNVNPMEIFLDRYDGALPEGVSCKDLCGFKGVANTRQYSSIAASYQLPGVVVYTLGEETGVTRRLRWGGIIFSTHPEEHSQAIPQHYVKITPVDTPDTISVPEKMITEPLQPEAYTPC